MFESEIPGSGYMKKRPGSQGVKALNGDVLIRNNGSQYTIKCENGTFSLDYAPKPETGERSNGPPGTIAYVTRRAKDLTKSAGKVTKAAGKVAVAAAAAVALLGAGDPAGLAPQGEIGNNASRIVLPTTPAVTDPQVDYRNSTRALVATPDPMFNPTANQSTSGPMSFLEEATAPETQTRNVPFYTKTETMGAGTSTQTQKRTMVPIDFKSNPLLATLQYYDTQLFENEKKMQVLGVRPGLMLVSRYPDRENLRKAIDAIERGDPETEVDRMKIPVEIFFEPTGRYNLEAPISVGQVRKAIEYLQTNQPRHIDATGVRFTKEHKNLLLESAKPTPSSIGSPPSKSTKG